MNLTLLREARIFPSAYLALRDGRARVLVCKNGFASYPKGRITGSGKLIVGFRRPGWPHPATEFIVEEQGRCELNGFSMILSGSSLHVARSGVLTLGSFYIDGGRIDCHESVTIGNGTMIGSGVNIMDTDHHRIEGQPMTAPVHIGDHVWICRNVTVLKGVRIGDGAMVGAGAVVTKDVPPGMLAAGIPARPIRPVTWSDE